MIREICSICGGILTYSILTCNPPIKKWECQKCGKIKTQSGLIHEEIIDMGNLQDD